MADVAAGSTALDGSMIGGVVVCHNDVCLENVVFHDGEAVALIDFDFAAPGRPLHDLANFARMCVPVDDPDSRARLGWDEVDVVRRLRLVADEYGLELGGRAAFVEVLSGTIQRGGHFVRRRVEAGEPAFVEMWETMGGQERFDRRRRWWDGIRPAVDAAMA